MKGGLSKINLNLSRQRQKWEAPHEAEGRRSEAECGVNIQKMIQLRRQRKVCRRYRDSIFWIKLTPHSASGLPPSASCGASHFCRCRDKLKMKFLFFFMLLSFVFCLHAEETLGQREQNLNNRLMYYLQNEDRSPESISGWAYYNMGNIFYELQQHPTAIYYYYKSLNKLPREEKVKKQLLASIQEAGISSQISQRPTLSHYLFFWHFLLSWRERVYIFVIAVILFSVSLSLLIWRNVKKMKNAAIVLTVFCSIFLLDLIYSRYFEPIQGVIIHPTFLYQNAGVQFPRIDFEPVLGGSLVTVLEISKDGKWLKVQKNASTIGFVNYKKIRLI